MVHLCVWLPGGGIFHAPLVVPDGVESGLDAATDIGTDAVAEDGGAGSLKIGDRGEAGVEKGGVRFYSPMTISSMVLMSMPARRMRSYCTLAMPLVTRCSR